jgi:hypothetical protein
MLKREGGNGCKNFKERNEDSKKDKSYNFLMGGRGEIKKIQMKHLQLKFSKMKLLFF